jgi:hypothetical protein
MSRFFPFSSLCLLALVACGPKTSTVSGTVTYKGQLLTYGKVVLLNGDGVPVQSEINEQGFYEVKGVTPGNLHAMVIQLPKDYKSPAEIRKELEASGVKEIDPAVFAPPKSLIPSKYGAFETSGLTVPVTPPKTTFDITLVDEP